MTPPGSVSDGPGTPNPPHDVGFSAAFLSAFLGHFSADLGPGCFSGPEGKTNGGLTGATKLRQTETWVQRPRDLGRQGTDAEAAGGDPRLSGDAGSEPAGGPGALTRGSRRAGAGGHEHLRGWTRPGRVVLGGKLHACVAMDSVGGARAGG